MANVKEVISQTFQRRRALNQSYSQNAFARDLGISPAALSQFLSGKRTLSKRNIQKASIAIGFPVENRQPKKGSEADEKVLRIKLESFHLIAEWYHLAILNLLEVAKIKTEKDVTERLGIDEGQARSALRRLCDLGFASFKNGRYERIVRPLTTGTDIPSEALRKHNREKMELAISSLEQVPIHQRDISSMTLTFDPQQMKKIKNEIDQFKKKITKICGKGQPSEVFSLNVQFFPLTKINNNEAFNEK